MEQTNMSTAVRWFDDIYMELDVAHDRSHVEQRTIIRRKWHADPTANGGSRRTNESKMKQKRCRESSGERESSYIAHHTPSQFRRDIC